ncbi:MAG: TonB-dependent receptor, partial [Candidatus Cloacimonetes bacterium]|nr:TonB-dependent receptor [Candidatus Cloacimonadota bacterium]
HTLKISPSALSQQVVMKRKSYRLENLTVYGKIETAETFSSNQTVIRNSEFQSKTDFNEIFSRYPEIALKGTMLPGEKKAVTILGHLPKHTSVFLDGIEISSEGQEFDISSIPVEIIEQVIVDKDGSGSSGSVAGSIKIYTKNYNSGNKSGRVGCSGSIDTKIGPFGLITSSVEAKTAWNYHYLYAFASQLSAQNNFPYEFNLSNPPITKKRENNQKNIQNYNFGYRFSLGLTDFSINYLRQNYDNGLAAPINQLAFYDKSAQKGYTERIFGGVDYSKGISELKISFYHFTDESQFDNSASSSPLNRFRAETEQGKSGILADSEIQWRFLQFFLKGSYDREFFKYRHYNSNNELNQNQSIPKVKSDSYKINPGSKIMIRINNFSLSCRFDYGINNYRKDDTIHFQNKNSWSGLVEFSFHKKWLFTSGTGLSRSFSRPSFYDIYWRGDSQTMGNPDLKPERSLSVKAFAKMEAEKISFKGSWSQNKIEDLIFWYKSVLGWKPDNISDAEMTNYELAAEIIPLSLLRISLSWLRTFALDKSYDESGEQSAVYNNEIIYIPSSRTAVSCSIGQPGLMLNVEYERVGKQWTKQDQLRPPLSAYEIFNVSAEYLYKYKTMEIGLYGRINNILDKRYLVYSSSPAAGRNWNFGLSIKYKKGEIK